MDGHAAPVGACWTAGGDRSALEAHRAGPALGTECRDVKGITGRGGVMVPDLRTGENGEAHRDRSGDP